jgi:hypothetical protein
MGEFCTSRHDRLQRLRILAMCLRKLVGDVRIRPISSETEDNP